jgi:nucleotide-binding universal stress UspA family protein
MNYENILVPVEFTPQCKPAISRASEIQQSTGASLTLAHVVDYTPPPYIQPQLPESLASPEALKKQADEYLDKLAREMGVGDHRKVVLTGNAKSSILELIERDNFDLVVMVKHNQTVIDTLAGSTSSATVKKAKCNVLVIHQ